MESELVDSFVAITGAPAHVAEHMLEAYGFDIDAAVNFYLESGGIGHGPFAMEQTLTGPSPVPANVSGYPHNASGGSPPANQPDSPIHVMDEDDDIQIVSATDAQPQAAAAAAARGARSGGSGGHNDPIPLLDDDEDVPQRRVRRNRPRGAAAMDRDMEALERQYGDEEFDPSAAVPDAGDPPPALPDDVDLEEQKMLMAAMLGQAYEGPVPDFRSDAWNQSRALSPGAQERQLLRQEQDAAYYESLAADREKAEAAERAQRDAAQAESLKQEEEQRAAREEQRRQEAYEKLIRDKEASLPPEPPSDDDGAVMLVIRMPDGKRHGRRFSKSNKLESVFNFVDVQSKDSELKPGSYNLVRQYPRQVFADGEMSLADADLVHKQEALFIEVKTP